MQLLLFSDELVIEESDTLQERLRVRLKNILTAPMAAEYTHKWKTTISPAGLAIPTITAAGHRTSGNGCGGDSGEMTGYPTPAANEFEPKDLEAMDKRRQECRARTANGNGFGLTLGMTVAGYPTANARDWNGPSGLPDQACPPKTISGYSTPTVTDHSRGGLPPRPTDTGIPLTQQVAGWATPVAADDGHKVTKNSHQPGNIGLVNGLISQSDNSGTASPGVLDAAFSRWLMGYPETWDEASPNYPEWLAVQERTASGV